MCQKDLWWPSMFGKLLKMKFNEITIIRTPDLCDFPAEAKKLSCGKKEPALPDNTCLSQMWKTEIDFFHRIFDFFGRSQHCAEKTCGGLLCSENCLKWKRGFIVENCSQNIAQFQKNLSRFCTTLSTQLKIWCSSVSSFQNKEKTRAIHTGVPGFGIETRISSIWIFYWYLKGLQNDVCTIWLFGYNYLTFEIWSENHVDGITSECPPQKHLKKEHLNRKEQEYCPNVRE